MIITLAKAIGAVVAATMLVATLAPAAAHATDATRTTDATRGVAAESSRSTANDLARATATEPSGTQFWYAAPPPRLDGRVDMIGRSGAQFWDHPFPPTWPDAFTTGASCEVACILWGKAHDNGNHTSVHLNVKTTTPMLWTLKVTNEALGYSVTKAEHNAWTTQATTTYTDLEAGTTYQATVTVKDQWGNVEEASGSFTTSN